MALDAARRVLASRSVEDAALEIERIQADATERAREQAARDLRELHECLARTTGLKGRTLGAIAEAARYLTDGTLTWLGHRPDGTRPRDPETTSAPATSTAPTRDPAALEERPDHWECQKPRCGAGGQCRSERSQYASAYLHLRNVHGMRPPDMALIKRWNTNAATTTTRTTSPTARSGGVTNRAR